MAQIRTTDTHLVVRLTGFGRVFGRWRPLEVPWQRVTGARIDTEAGRALPGIRWGMSSHLPGIAKLGSFRRGGRLDFWGVANPDQTVVIELAGDKYDRLILEVADPVAAVAEIHAHLDRLRR
jgi:hypothetical protein